MTPQEFETILRDPDALGPIFSALSDDVIVVCPKGTIVYVNRKGPPGEPSLIGRNMFSDSPAGLRALREVMRTGRPVSYESECAPFGKPAHYAATVNPFRWKGRLRGAVVVARNIADRKQTERELAASTEMLDGVLANVPDYVTLMDPRGKLLYINKVGKGLTRAQLIGSDSIGYAHPADRPTLRRLVRQVLKTGKPGFLETRRIGPGGQVLRYRNWLQRIINQGGEASVLAVSSDVTAFREAEEKKQRAQSELERSRNLLDGVMANVPAFVLKIDRRLRIAYINKLAKGFKMSDVIGSDALAYVDPRDRVRVGQELRAVFRTGQPSVSEMRGQGDHKSTRYYLTRFQPVFEQGRVEGILMLTTDITDRRMAEEKLKQSQESYRLIFEANPSPMVVGDRATYQWLAVNDAAVKHYGYSREEWLKMTAGDIHPPDERERLKRHPIGYGLVSHGVWKQKKKDGTIIDVDITTNTLRFQGRDAIMGTFRDVTAERRAQAASQQSRQDYMSLFQGHPLPMWVGDMATLRILDVNAAAVKAFGYSREEFLGMRITKLRASKEVPTLLGRIRARKFGMQGAAEYRRKNGATFEAEVYVSELEFEGRRAFVTSAMDLSDRIKGREAQERFAGLFNSSRDGLSFVSMDGTLLEINDALCRMLRYRRSELIGHKTFMGLTVPEYREINQAVVERVLATGDAAEFEKEYFRKDGSRMPAVVTVFRVNGADGSPSGVAAIVRDSTERKRLEREILEIGAREQSRIGRELHDSVGQHLTGVSFLAKSLKSQLSREGSPQSRLAERIAQTASDAVEQVRALAAGLVPAELLPDGLPAALRAMGVQAERTFGIEVSVECPARLAGMEEASLLHLYRIAQEATANAAKHSGASKVEIALREGGGRIVLEISDNGKGISRREGKGLGLRIMAHRAQMLGGTFEAKRDKSGGTIVSCTCPARRPLL